LVEYHINKASESEIAEHLLLCDTSFVPPLSERVDIKVYSTKIFEHTIRFEAWADNKLIGLVAAYCNDRDKLMAYITSVSVLKKWNNKGIATQLMQLCINHSRNAGMLSIGLEVARQNKAAIKLYEKSGFLSDFSNPSFVTMKLLFKSGQVDDNQS
jgi:ribosomal protein S18 acetylase RimI-like enzyme